MNSSLGREGFLWFTQGGAEAGIQVEQKSRCRNWSRDYGGILLIGLFYMALLAFIVTMWLNSPDMNLKPAYRTAFPCLEIIEERIQTA